MVIRGKVDSANAPRAAEVYRSDRLKSPMKTAKNKMPSIPTPSQSLPLGHRLFSASATGNSRRKPRPNRTPASVAGSVAPITYRVTAVLIPPRELDRIAAKIPRPSSPSPVRRVSPYDPCFARSMTAPNKQVSGALSQPVSSQSITVGVIRGGSPLRTVWARRSPGIAAWGRLSSPSAPPDHGKTWPSARPWERSSRSGSPGP